MTNVYVYVGRRAAHNYIGTLLSMAGIDYRLLRENPFRGRVEMEAPALIAGNIKTRQAVIYEDPSDIADFVHNATLGPRDRAYAEITRILVNSAPRNGNGHSAKGL